MSSSCAQILYFVRQSIVDEDPSFVSGPGRAGRPVCANREEETLPVSTLSLFKKGVILGMNASGAAALKIFFVLFWRRINAQRCFDVMYEQCIGFCAKRALGRHRSCSYCRERAESSHSKGFLKGKLQEKYVAACSRMQPHAAACSSMQQHAAA